MVGSVGDFPSFAPCADLKALKDAAVLISMDQLAGQCTVRRHTLSLRRVTKIICIDVQILRRREKKKFVGCVEIKHGCQIKNDLVRGRRLHLRVPHAAIESLGGHCQAVTSPAPTTHHPRPRWMNSSQADVSWGDEGCDTDTECTRRSVCADSSCLSAR